MRPGRAAGPARPDAPGRSWLAEPVLHFLVLGVGLFVLWGALGPRPDPHHLVLTRATIDGLRQDHERRHGRPPSPEEERALVERFVEGEILTREALDLGLDQGDPVVRARLLQKMDFLLDEEADPGEPDEAALASTLAAHPERWRPPDRVTLTQVFVRGGRPDGAEARVAAELREKLLAGTDPAGLGDPFPLGQELEAQSRADLARSFGPSFADAVSELTGDGWSPPLRSTFGLHLVRVRARETGRLPELDGVRDAVRRAWTEERRAAEKRGAIERLRSGYTVEIEQAAP